MRSLIFLLLAPIVLSAAPFCGPFVGGGIGWDGLQVEERRANVRDGFPPLLVSEASGNDFVGFGYLGWMVGTGCSRMGLRIGYAGFSGSAVDVRGEFDRSQGAFIDITPGIRFGNCWLAHLLFGIGWSKYHYQIDEGVNFRRDQNRWAFNPRVGFGVQWAFWCRSTLGLEWHYKLPYNVVYRTPNNAGQGTDRFYRTERVEGNQVALTLNWYFG